MIVLHSKKLIFLKTRKTAGSSFEIALSKYGRPEDIITSVGRTDDELRKKLGYPGVQNNKMSVIDMFRHPSLRILKNLRRWKWPDKFYNHMTAKRTKQLLGSEIWNSYTKVAIVRNPYDYAVSSYFWANRRNDAPKSFEDWVLSKQKIFRFNTARMYIENELVIDHLIRFENFEEDIVKLEQVIDLHGLYDTFREIRAKGSHRPKGATVSEMFKGADALKAVIEKECSFEIQKFGYQPPK